MSDAPPTRPPEDPAEPDRRLEALRRALAGRPSPRLPVDPSLAQAAVLLAVRPTEPLELLLIRRAEQEGDPWSGHMALPGGRREPADADLLSTALREAREELGLEVPRSAVLGELVEVRPQARRRMSITVVSWVAAVPVATTLRPAPSEVDVALWVPLPELASEEAVAEFLIELEGEARSFPALSYQEYLIWGLTHGILEDFIEVARGAGLV